MITLRDIEDAAERVERVIRPTPLRPADALSRMAGRPVLLKHEELQRTGSFKIRGAYNFISRLEPGTEVVAASAGNHAQGVALAASLTGVRATIFMPATASLPKIEATRDYGGIVQLGGIDVEECIHAATEHAAATGARYVPPFDDPLVMAGQGTLGLELAEIPQDAVVAVPVGGGGLIAGVATALHHRRPDVRVVGVQAAGAAAMRASLDAGRVVPVTRAATMADGVAVRAPSEATLRHVQAHVDDLLTVSEEEISRAVVLLLERGKAVVEPAGAVGVAGVLSGSIAGDVPAVAVISGGNVDPLLLMRIIDHGLSAAGRYLLLRIELDDRPGMLAELSAAVAALSLNVLHVDHHRAGTQLGVNEVEVLMTVETRDPAHRDEVIATLRAQGFRVDLVR